MAHQIFSKESFTFVTKVKLLFTQTWLIYIFIVDKANTFLQTKIFQMSVGFW